MYLLHWGLGHSPFATTTGLALAYPSEACDEATARVDYLVGEQRRMGAILGETGWGKSTVALEIAQRLRRSGAAVSLVDAVALTPQELLWRLAADLGAAPDAGDATPTLWRRVEETLQHLRWQNRAAVLLIDDADQAGPDLQRQLVRLAGLESAPGAKWTLLLTADPGRLANLSEPLLHRIDLRVDLFPWTADDTAGYVQNSLVAAGRVLPIFTDAALTRLHELSEGIPRRVVRIADFALVLGAGAGLDAVSPAEIDAAMDELSWSPAKRVELV